MARHLILGGSGFIGRHVALALLRRNDAVVIASRSAMKENPPDANAELLSFIPCDLASADWDAILLDGDVVHHYACSTIPQTANDDPLSDLDVNVRGTLRLLEALRKRHGTRLVFPSSGGTIYGPLQHTPVSEDHPLNPITAYGASKVAIEKYLGFYRAMYGLDLRVARLSNPYGHGQDPRRKQGAASIFLHLALANQPIEVWGDGSVVRDYIHIADVVAGLLALASAEPERLIDHPIFNIGSGTGESITDILTLLEERLNRALHVTYMPGRQFDVKSNVLDIRRAHSVLGWSPRLGFRDGMELMIRDHVAGNVNYSTLPFVSEARGTRARCGRFGPH
ncbi:MAG: NAD-dependent epimerase/dehydratase family protein [Acidiferrobacteraceae bacterium]